MTTALIIERKHNELQRHVQRHDGRPENPIDE